MADHIDLEYWPKSLYVENAIGGVRLLTLHKLIQDSSKSYWPTTMSGVKTILDYILARMAESTPEHTDDWLRLKQMLMLLQSMAPADHGMPRVLVGDYFALLLLFQNIKPERGPTSREVMLIHAAFGEMLDVYAKAIIRANHTNFVNKL